MLDFSQRHELTLHSEVAANVTSALEGMGHAGIVVGACARDLHLHYGAGIPIQRGTEDIDFAFLVGSWAQFEALRGRLLESGSFQGMPERQHRLRHCNGIKVDLVPFGAIETGERRIAWPPSGDFVMDVFGFREALATADIVLLPASVAIQIVSLPALGILKIVAWQDRRYRSPGKDAVDLNLIVRNYLAISGNAERLFVDHIDWTEEPDFDYEYSGARLLGDDMRRLVDERGFQKISEILRAQIEYGGPGELTQDMDRHDPQRAMALLNSLYRGFSRPRAE